MEKAQGLQRLDGGVEPPMGHHRRRRCSRCQRLDELAIGAGGGGLAEHDEEVAVGARHGHHVASREQSSASGFPWLIILVGSSGSSTVGDGTAVDGGSRGDVEVQVHALLPGSDPALLQRLPVEVIHPPRLHANKTKNHNIACIKRHYRYTMMRQS